MISAVTPLPVPPKRVLIIKPSSLGDVVTGMPVLRGLRRTHPDAHIAWLISTTCSDILENDPDLDEIIYFERKKLGKCWRSPLALAGLISFKRKLRRGNFDWVIDLQGLARSAIFTGWTKAPLRVGFAGAREGAGRFYNRQVEIKAKHTVDRNIELGRSLGIDSQPEDMSLYIRPEAEEFAKNFRHEHGLTGRDYLICVPPTRWETKLYPIRHWRRVITELSHKLPIVLLGSPSPGEMQLCGEIAEGFDGGVINTAGQTKLTEMVALIANSRGVICCDSAAKFIAPAVGVNAITLIGPTNPELTGPYLKGQALIGDVNCQGCLKKKCPHITCMQSISPDKVVAAAMEML